MKKSRNRNQRGPAARAKGKPTPAHPTQTVCLNMIVKNESRVIGRCFDSVRPFIHRWVIVDTGSTDGTQDLIRKRLAGIPGELHERPWKDFGHNRSEALALARGKSDYILIMDADERLEVPTGYRFPQLTADKYMVAHRHADAPDSTWGLGTLVKASLPWRYEGVLHEYIVCDEPHELATLHGPVVWGHFDSARNVDPLAKYANDAKILEAALEKEPDNARYTFYLAQSYRDSKQLEKAAEAYARRIALGGWDEELFYSAYQRGAVLETLGDWPRALESYLKAYELRPARAESLWACAVHYRVASAWGPAELFARAAAAIPRPDDTLFLDDSVYTWRAIDELAIATYYVGKRAESRALNERLLAEGHVPASDRPRILANLEFAKNA
ncbi:MAG TPA: glycosyltransferase [Polyangiaceae bacterium]|nr:glycosyltransferase [Polyangiaceae bacterium]